MNVPVYQAQSVIRYRTEDIERVADSLKAEPAALRAVLEVECRGSGFLPDGRLTMLYEPHIAYRYAPKALRGELTKAGVAAVSWGDLPYPPLASGRYAQFDTCARIGGLELACKATSWGLPQAMGFNFDPFGYNSAEDMVAQFTMGGEPEQLSALGRFVRSTPAMHRALISLDWATFARLYNGKGYKVNRYDVKLASAYLKFRPAKIGNAFTRVLMRGMKGEDVRALQRLMVRAGIPVDTDAYFGAVTEQQLVLFQTQNKLTRDGRAGPETIAALEAAPSNPQ